MARKVVRSSDAATAPGWCGYKTAGIRNRKSGSTLTTVQGGLRDAQSQLNKMLSERDRGRNLDSSKQMLNQYLGSAVSILHVAPRELDEFIGDSEHIADGGVSRAGAFAEAFPGSCRSTSGSNHAAVRNARLRGPHSTREGRRHRHVFRHVMRAPKADSAAIVVSA